MRFGAALLIAAVSTGCVHGSQGTLVSARAGVQAVKAPVVCGPIGFRKTPLQARWGEYVKVTVTAQTALRGTVLVHAAGVAQEPQAFVADGAGAVVVDARFPNADPDRRFALERERPIDITLTTLEGTCEGAVFTVEQGALVPDVDDRAWIAELERRGGPELAARREAARREADARREAHYAEWAARRVEVSAEVLAQREAIREAHYAAVDARRAAAAEPAAAPTVEAEAVVEVAAHDAEQWAVPSRGAAHGGNVSAVAVATVEGGASSVSGGDTQWGVAVVTVEGGASSVSSGDAQWGAPAGSASAMAAGSSAQGGASGGNAGAVAVANVDAAAPTGNVSAVAVVTVEGSMQGSAAPTSLAEATAQADVAFAHAELELAQAEVGLAQAQVAATTVASAPSEWHSYEAALSMNANAWAAPPTPSANWVQPYQPSLQPVAVTSETSVPCPPGTEPVGHVEVVAPGVINLLLDVASALTVAPVGAVHGAQPVSR